MHSFLRHSKECHRVVATAEKQAYISIGGLDVIDPHAKYMNLTVSGWTVTARAITVGVLSSLLSE